MFLQLSFPLARSQKCLLAGGEVQEEIVWELLWSQCLGLANQTRDCMATVPMSPCHRVELQCPRDTFVFPGHAVSTLLALQP